jgi:hypothetical protein
MNRKKQFVIGKSIEVVLKFSIGLIEIDGDFPIAS